MARSSSCVAALFRLIPSRSHLLTMESDVDLLVVFEDDARPSLLTMARLERELSELIGRKVDLRTKRELSRLFRNEVVSAALPQYERS